jgi:hypothetical protein
VYAGKEKTVQMKNNLDRLFKEKLSEREFEFKETYWQQAEQLLDASHTHKRRAFWWWSGAVVVLLLLSGAAWWVLGISEEVPAAPTQLSSPVAGAGKALSAEPPTLAAPAEITPAGQPQADPAIARNQTPVEQPFSEKNSAGKGVISSGGRLGFSKKGNNAGAANTLENNAKTGTIFPLGGEAEQPAETSEPLNLQANFATESSENNPVIKAEVPDRRWENFPPIEQLSLPVEGNFSEKPALGVNGFEPSSRRRFSFGIGAASHFQFGEGGEKAIAWRVGTLVRYRLTSNVFLGSGLAYLRRTGTFFPTKRNAVVAYSFGKSIDNSALKPSSLHYLSMPLTVGFFKKRHEIEAGITANYLLGVRGAKGEEFIGHSPEPPYYLTLLFQPEQKGWIVEEGFRRFFPELTLGYRYRLNRHLSAGAGAWFTPGKILSNPDQALLQQADRWYFGLMGVYVF